MAKHVIVLGAGASCASGYPDSRKLRTVLSSTKEFGDYVTRHCVDLRLCKELINGFKNLCEGQRGPHAFRGLGAFWDGEFETVDEFSFRFRDDLKPAVQALKCYTSWVLALNNPEGRSGSVETVEDACLKGLDYPEFVGKLFRKGSACLHDDVAVLTYNYDAYLDYVLWRAFRARMDDRAEIPAALLSGLGRWDADALLEDEEKGFCFLKLHGTSVVPESCPPNMRHERPPLTFAEVFEDRTQLGKGLAGFTEDHLQTPPMFFPWELLTESGAFVTRNQFWAVDHTVDNRPYYPIFKAIWTRAQREVTDAERISFVGFSAHEFMGPGLRFLFKQRAKEIAGGSTRTLQVVTANPETSSLRSRDHHVDGLEKMLRAACRRLPCGKVVCREDFKSFIRFEL